MGAKNLSLSTAENAATIANIEEQSGSKLHECYQCGKCSAGCPMAEGMDLLPRQVIRYLQLGLVDEVLHSKSPWVCASCHTCTARCPHDVNISGIMEAVRQTADRKDIHPVHTTKVFTKYFLLPVKLWGRSHEMTMTAFYNVFSGRLLQNFQYVPKMITGMKLRILPERVKDKESMTRLLQNCEKEVNGR